MNAKPVDFDIPATENGGLGWGMTGASDKKGAGEGPAEFAPAGAPGDDPLTRNLKKVYEQVTAEPIPSEWLQLLEQLDQKMSGDDGDGTPHG